MYDDLVVCKPVDIGPGVTCEAVVVSSPVVCLCDTPGVVRRPSSVVCVVSSNLTTADMKEII